ASCSLAALAVAAFAGVAQAQVAAPQRTELTSHVDNGATRLGSVAQQIWNLAEVGYQETKSSALLQEELKASGFTVQAGVAGMPTAFIASFKNGDGPVVAILAEFDALPGLAQH